MIFDRREDIEKFIAVAEAGSVLAGANALRITQPALSRVVARLERRCGKRLFERHSRGITLTEVGVRALECARRLLREHEAADSELMGVPDRPEAATAPGTAPKITPEEHLRLSRWLTEEAHRRSGMKTLLEHQGKVGDMPRHELGQLWSLCRAADDDSAALVRAADIVRCTGPDLRR